MVSKLHAGTVARATSKRNSQRYFSARYTGGMSRKEKLFLLIRDRYGGNQAEFARAIRRAPALIYQYLTERREIGEKFARHVEQALRLPARWFDDPNAGEEEFPREPSEEDFALIPQYTARGGCGPGALNGHVEVRGGLSFRREWLARLRVQPDQAVVVYAQGESMEPTIHDGAVVMLDLSRAEPSNGRVFALLVESEVRIKRVFRLISGGWKLSSDNPDKSRYPDEVVSDLQAVTVIGLVVWQGGTVI